MYIKFNDVKNKLFNVGGGYNEGFQRFEMGNLQYVFVWGVKMRAHENKPITVYWKDCNKLLTVKENVFN